MTEPLSFAMPARDRSLAERERHLARARRMHIVLTHDGDDAACRCVLRRTDQTEDVVVGHLAVDVDGDPLGVQSERYPITGCEWVTPP